MFDFIAETHGLNRRKLERLPDYLLRVWNDPIFSYSRCEGN